MQLLNLTIDRIIIHQVYQMDDDGNKISPWQSHEYTNFDQSAMEAFKKRVVDALGDGSKAVQMEIKHQDPDDLPSIVDQMIDQDNDSFAVSSYDIAKKLTKAQDRRNIPGGIIVVFSGKQGPHSKNFLGIIKAEIHTGYEKITDPKTKVLSLKFVEEVLLTPGARLYKTAGFYEKSNFDESNPDLNEKWTVMVSDYQINPVDGKAAAQYFFSGFLGCGYPQSSGRKTLQFYESTLSFISELEVPPAKKSDLLNALTTYLKVDTSTTISSSDFAAKYFELDTQDSFTEHMEESGIPPVAFTKDIVHIESKLKFRKVNFGCNIKITGPPNAFKELITIDAIEGDPDASGAPAEWTKVIIKDKISRQE